MSNPICVIGDIHGAIDELKELHLSLKSLGLTNIWCVGDIVDRGPDSTGCIRYCIENNIKSVLGNHDESICNHYRNFRLTGKLPYNQDKLLTLSQFQSSSDGEHLYNWLNELPPLQVFDSEKLILVHGGLWPNLPLHKQPHNIIRTQMVCPQYPGATRWWGEDAKYSKSGKTEDQSRSEGWERWYRLYDFDYTTIYGHSTWAQPFIHQNLGFGKTIGIDTGTSFGGTLTACIYSKDSPEFFISVKNKKIYYKDTVRSFWEE